jgi:uncharacterized membrane-anchored protein YjiN (DUF445 family)
MKPMSPATEREQRMRLRRMKRLPLLLLALMGLLFVLTLHRPDGWAGWLHAFAEAGMVGALADWFAVAALFRHPLGIPIPHTAIIPRRKDEIGASMARFVADHFLEPQAVQSKLQSVNLARKSAVWLRSRHGRERVTELVISLLRWALGALHEERVRHFIRRLGSRQLSDVNLAPMFGRVLGWLIDDGRHQQVFTQVLRLAIVLLHDNRETIRGNVQRGSPWWLPGFIDDRIVVEMLSRIETLLLAMALDPEHEMRDDFDRWMSAWAHELQHSPEYATWGEHLKQDLAGNQELQDYLYGLWVDLSAGLESDLEDPESSLRRQLDRLLTGLAEELEQDSRMQAWINGWVVELATTVVDENRHAIASLVSDTVESWDAADTSDRVELAIGRDLQFIRINGTLVGGLVGLAIHALLLL